MLGFIPIIGPIIQGITSIWNKFQDKQIVEIQTAGQITQTETTVSGQIIHDTQDDIGLRLIRDLACLLPVVYTNVYVWDRMIDNSHPEWVINVKPLDYMPWLVYAVYVFLLGNIGINAWKRR